MIKLMVGENEFALETMAGLVAHDGWGMAPVNRFAQRGAQQHGDSDAGYLLEPRFGSLVFRMPATSLEQMYEQRKRLLRLFAPGNSLRLRFDMTYGQREIAVVYASDMSLPWEAGDWAAQKFILTLKAPDPTFYDPKIKALIFGVAASGDWASAWAIPWRIPWPIGDNSISTPASTGMKVTGTWSIPWSIPWAIGEASFDDTQDIEYEGDFISYPVNYITGPIRDCVITNELTGDKLDFTGAMIPAGDVWTVDCRYGYKTVTDALGNNQRDKLTTDSDLVTFGLAAAEDGSGSCINPIRVRGRDGNTLSNVMLSYYVKYLGL